VDDEDLTATDSSSEHSTASSTGSDVGGSAKGESDEEAPSWLQQVTITNALVSLTSKSEHPWDVEIPVKVVMYTILTYCVVEVMPRVFQLLGV